MSAVNIDKLAIEVMRNLQVYRSATVDIITDAVKDTAKKTVEKLHADSPEREGNYAQSWAWKKDPNIRGAYRFSVVVYSKSPHYRLAHLLEKGHALVRGGRKIGSAKAIPHIADAEALAIDMLTDEIVSRIEKNTR